MTPRDEEPSAGTNGDGDGSGTQSRRSIARSTVEILSSSRELAEKRPNSKLSTRAKKMGLIQAIASGMTITAASAHMGLSSSRYYEWMRRDPDFRRMLEQAQDRVYDEALGGVITHAVRNLRSLAPASVEVLWKALDSDDEATQMRAARMVLRYVQEFNQKDPKGLQPEGFEDLMRRADDATDARPLTD